MAQYKYTLPSGAEFQVDVPNGTTQAQADAIFYGQVAAGTFVDYEPGDTLTSAEIALTNFGLSRLERGTAGVDDKTLLAITSGLAVVVDLPSTVGAAVVATPVDTASYIQVTSNPDQGLLDQGPNDIGSLSRPEVQAVMSALTVQAYNVLSMLGVGKYGFNGPQLIRVGYIKSVYETDFAVDPSTQANPPDFITLMNSPTVWTGLDGVITVDDILNNESLQNSIQERLMNQSYNTLVSSGLITPPIATTTTPVAAVGQVYDTTGQMVSTPAVALLTASPIASVADSSTVVGNTSPEITRLGTTATAVAQQGQGSLSSGAVNFSGGQIAGLAAGLGLAAAARTLTVIPRHRRYWRTCSQC
jgi:hypothetical protein